jgi:1-acyl-sn-glycerol-3-phosphate acyltransferase
VDALGDDGILIYPEGTRFTPEKREKILASIAKKHPERFQAASALKNVLPPHLGGPLALLERNEREGADVVVCAHTGLEGTRDLRHFLNGSMLGAAIRVKFWRVPFAEIPLEREARIAWLYAWWTRVDSWIGEQRG